MVKILGLIAAALLLTAAIAPAARADTTAFTAPVSLTEYPSGPVNLGMVFTVNSGISVDALGFYKVPGLTGGSTVAIYGSSGNLLTSSFVPLTDPVVSGYFYQSIGPISLAAGDQYTVVEFTDSSPYYWSAGATPTTDPSITFNYQDYLYSGSLGFPTNTVDSAGPYYGPDFFIATPTSAVTEPSTLFLFCTGLLGVAGAARKRYLTQSVSSAPETPRARHLSCRDLDDLESQLGGFRLGVFEL
jgi:hypothetical protein